MSANPQAKPKYDLSVLTEREKEVLQLVGEGLTLSEIARKLFRSTKTIESHRLSLGRKLKANNRVELARIAIQTGLVRLQKTDLHEQERTSEELREALCRSQKAARLIETIDHGTSGSHGQEFFQKLVLSLTDALGTTFGHVSKLRVNNPDKLRALAVCQNGKLLDYRDEVDLPGTPCEQVLIQQVAHFPDHVQQRFPRDPFLKEIHAKSYIGAGLYDVKGNPIGAVAVIHDGPIESVVDPVTVLRIFAGRASAELARMRAEAELSDAQERLRNRGDEWYRTFIETMTMGLAALDANQNITYVNDYLCEMLGYEPQEMIGRPAIDFFVNPKAKEIDRRRRLRERGALGPYEQQMRRKDGSTLWALVSPRSLFDTQGQFIGSFGVVTDITDRKFAEQQLLRSCNDLEAKLREKVDDLGVEINASSRL